MKKIFLLVLIMTLTGCQSLTSFFFYPDDIYFATPKDLNLIYEEVTLTTKDGEKLVNWWLPAQENLHVITSKATVLFLHGNAENISTHMYSVAWLALQGYSVFMLDYRGFGKSSGYPGLPNIFNDVDAAAHWLSKKDSVNSKPVYLMGQSIGASIAATWVTRNKNQDLFNAVVLDAPFGSWPSIAKTAMSKQWQTWILLPGCFLIPSKWDANKHIHKLNLPLLVIHSKDDSIIPLKEPQSIYNNSLTSKEWLSTHGYHIATFTQKENREFLLLFFDKHI